MANLRESAQAYEPKATKNVTDLEAVSLNIQIEERTGADNEGKPYSYYVALLAGEEYRVPSAVLKDIKAILTAKPNLKTVRVIKQGTGMATRYTVIPLE